MKQASVFVFTLGLTESWRHAQHGYTYPMCPGTAGGTFDADVHIFENLGFDECRADLSYICTQLSKLNPNLRVLLTVSPVMLVASMEPRGALQSSVASKSILRAAADACVREHDQVDYFPAFEIISSPAARGMFYDASLRDVRPEGVSLVMKTLFSSRFGIAQPEAGQHKVASDNLTIHKSSLSTLEKVLGIECDEILLDKYT